MSDTTVPRKRTRDPAGKRTAILAAARAVFAEYGYEKATIREIAHRAGVTHGLVALHFTTKQKLFFAAVPGPSLLATSVAGDLDGLPARVAGAYVARMEARESTDPFIALARSAAGDLDVARELLHGMREEAAAAYREVLTGPDADLRVELARAHLVGVTLSRYVLADGPLAAMSPDELIDRLTRTLHTILLG